MDNRSIVNPGVEVTVAMRGPCNYSCHYCVAGNAREKTVLHSLERVREIYENIGAFTVTAIECSSGEPTIHPQIRDILDICSETGMVSIPTNNSIRPEKWLSIKKPEFIRVRAALHPQSEADIEAFTNRLLYIRDKGASVQVIFVAHPERMDKLRNYQDTFLKHDIEVALTPFIGTYRGRKYPDGYATEERTLLKLDQTGIWWYTRLLPEMTIRDFSGIPCIAGFRTIFVGENDEIRRCLYDNTILKMPYKSSVPCKVTCCGCGLMLEDLNIYDETYWNFWYKLAGKELIPEEQKQSDEIYGEKESVYWYLMGRYQKV